MTCAHKSILSDRTVTPRFVHREATVQLEKVVKHRQPTAVFPDEGILMNQRFSQGFMHRQEYSTCV